MQMTLWRPFRELSPFRSEVDNLFDRFFSNQLFEPRSKSLVPALEFIEDDDKYRLQIELPGVDKKDVSITLKDDYLVIKGEKKSAKEEEKDLCHCSERYYGSFERSLRLPGVVNGDKVEAHFNKGVLEITLPKTEETKPKEVKIKAA